MKLYEAWFKKENKNFKTYRNMGAVLNRKTLNTILSLSVRRNLACSKYKHYSIIISHFNFPSNKSLSLKLCSSFNNKILYFLLTTT